MTGIPSAQQPSAVSLPSQQDEVAEAPPQHDDVFAVASSFLASGPQGQEAHEHFPGGHLHASDVAPASPVERHNAQSFSTLLRQAHSIEKKYRLPPEHPQASFFWQHGAAHFGHVQSSLHVHFPTKSDQAKHRAISLRILRTVLNPKVM